MRTISELLTILRDNIKVVDNEIYDGLCQEVFILDESDVISIYEKDKLHEYIEENKPYYEYKNMYGMTVESSYGWPRCEWLPRLKWLNEHIELTKDLQQ